MKNTNVESLKKHFSFLLSKVAFTLKEIKSYDYGLYAKLLSGSVGLYFIYEFRDSIPQIQFTLLEGADELAARPGLYTLRESYKDKNFHLKSFYLDEIISFKNGGEYNDYFKGAKTIEAAIKISEELIKKYAEDFVAGRVETYAKINAWFKTKVMDS